MKKAQIVGAIVASFISIGCSSYPDNSTFPTNEALFSYDKSLHYVGEKQDIIINGKLDYVLADVANKSSHKWSTLDGSIASVTKRTNRQSLLIDAYPKFEFKMDYHFEGDSLKRRLFIKNESLLSIESKRDAYAVAAKLDEMVTSELNYHIHQMAE